jgi:cell division protein FtsL
MQIQITQEITHINETIKHNKHENGNMQKHSSGLDMPKTLTYI